LADIPGLIEGASDGKGLGIKFLKHVERTKIIFHFLAADSEDIVADYKTIRAELAAFNPLLIEKPEYILVSRSDTVTEKELKKILTKAKKINKNAIPISIHNWEQLQVVKEVLNKMDEEKQLGN
jgi:GTP-binding protein